MGSTSTEARINKLQKDFHAAARREGSIDSLCVNDKKRWRVIRKEFEKRGITLAALEANKDNLDD